MKHAFAVKHGSTFTTFQTSAAMLAYWKVTLGSVRMVRTYSAWERF